jgi:hypothetical protein
MDLRSSHSSAGRRVGRPLIEDDDGTGNELIVRQRHVEASGSHGRGAFESLPIEVQLRLT